MYCLLMEYISLAEAGYAHAYIGPNMNWKVMVMTKVRSIKQITGNKFLNYYELEAESRAGSVFPYFMASRAEETEHLYLNDPERSPDGVMIFALCGENRDKVVLIRQFRYPVGKRVYEFPAGLVEQGEDYHEAAVREMKEETGLDLKIIHADPMYEQAMFTSDGMSDERCCVVFGIAEGEVSEAGLEGTEDVEVVIADREQAGQVLKNGPLALMCGYMLMHFLKDRENPFPFPWDGTLQ